MARPKQERQVARPPEVTYFKPQGVPMVYLEEVCLPVEELEAVRLADLEGLSQAEGALAMGVSRHTFGRVLASARRNIARALVSGLALKIEGGHWVFGQSENTAACRRQKPFSGAAEAKRPPQNTDPAD